MADEEETIEQLTSEELASLPAKEAVERVLGIRSVQMELFLEVLTHAVYDKPGTSTPDGVIGGLADVARGDYSPAHLTGLMETALETPDDPKVTAAAERLAENVREWFTAATSTASALTGQYL
jgi:hypothetical protein